MDHDPFVRTRNNALSQGVTLRAAVYIYPAPTQFAQDQREVCLKDRCCCTGSESAFQTNTAREMRNKCPAMHSR
ncbi:unnamed protein product [Ectocarpus fasciculatus]